MATLYGRGRGRAGSHAPKSEKPYWLKITPEEVEELVVKLAQEEIPAAKIGLILRDSHGVHSVRAITGKKIQKILAEHGFKPKTQEIHALEKRIKELKEHFEKNKQDKVAKRGLQLAMAKLDRLNRYIGKKKGESTRDTAKIERKKAKG